MPAREQENPIHTLLQITDSHLFDDPADTLLGLPTLASLKAVVELAAGEHPDVDLVLATGDISQDFSAASYSHFASCIKRINAPMRWIPGNHDKPQVQQAAARGHDWSEPVFDLPGWRIVLLDSAVSGKVHGWLQQDQLELLEQALQSAGERHVLVCLHHHPVPVGSTWLDRIGLRNPGELFGVLDRHASVRGLLWGHIHQEVDSTRQGVRLLASPSTCIQFAPGSSEFSLDTRLPGYRWLRLYPDGTIETAVSRLQQLEHEIDYSGVGY